MHILSEDAIKTGWAKLNFARQVLTRRVFLPIKLLPLNAIPLNRENMPDIFSALRFVFLVCVCVKQLNYKL